MNGITEVKKLSIAWYWNYKMKPKSQSRKGGKL